MIKEVIILGISLPILSKLSSSLIAFKAEPLLRSFAILIRLLLESFPEIDKTYCIIAWLKEYDSVFSSIASRLNNLDEQQKRNYVNNTLAFITENIAIKPSSWDSLSEQAKNEFMNIFCGLADLLECDGKKFDRFNTPTFDLFSL